MPDTETQAAAASSPRLGFCSRFFLPVDIASLVLFRIVFGVIVVWEVWRYFESDWVRSYYIEPTFYFKYFGFDWVHPWPGDGMYLHMLAVGVGGACVAVGFLYRVSAVLVFLGMTYWYLLDQTRYLNHLYLVSLLAFLMVFIPCHRSRSVDAWLRPSLRRDTAPNWTLWLLRFQLFVVYFLAAAAKLNPDWLQGEPMRMWLARRQDYRLIGPLFGEEWCVYSFAYGGILYDALVVPLLLWRRTRALAYLFSVGFHLINAIVFSIGIFPWLMLAATTIYFSPDWPRRHYVFMPLRPEPIPSCAPSGPLSWRRRLAVALLGLWAVFQILVPLRHWVYPGDVQWTEEGHRFAWRMKLRSKSGQGVITVSDPITGRTQRVNPRRCSDLTPAQGREAIVHPDMLLQFCHHLAVKYGQRWNTEVEVRATVRCSLNGRRPELLLDPNVDLAKTPRNLWHADWILPLTEPLRPAEDDPDPEQSAEGAAED